MLPEILSQYGWFIVLLGVILYILKEKFGNRLQTNTKLDGRQVASDLAFERNEAMERAILKMQQKADQDAILMREKLKAKEAKDKENKLNKLLKTNPSQKRLINNDYNPLMGSSMPNYRPVRDCGTSGG